MQIIIENDLNENMTEPVSSISTKAVNYVNLIIKISVILLVGLLVHAIYKGLKQEGYIIQSFQVPKEFSDNGYNGIVVAKQLQDKIAEIKVSAQSVREDSLNISSGNNSNLDVDVMGIGVSSSSLTHQLRELFGIKLNAINGELTQLDDILNLTLRLWDKPPIIISERFIDGAKAEAYNRLIEKAAEKVLYYLDPYFLAIRLYSSDRIEEAEDLLRTMINEMPNEKKWAYHAWGNLKMRLNENEMADEFYMRALEIDPDFSLTNRALGWSYHSKGEYQKAVGHFEKSLLQDEQNFGANNGIAMGYVKLGDLDKAESFYKKNIDNDPSNLWAYANYSSMLLQIKKDTPAVKALIVEASKKVPYNDDYYLAIAQNYFIEERIDSAMYFVRKALDFNPYNVGALSSSSQFYGHTKDYEKQEEEIKNLVNALNRGQYDSYMRMNAHNNLAICFYNQSKLDSAFVHAQKSIGYMPTYAIPYTTLAEVYYFKRDYKMFWATIEKAFDMGLEFREDWLKDPPYSELVNNKRFMGLIQTSNEKLKG